ncbi:MAG: hypothetical protein GC154_16940 [bacterium]|nr:hypothetical protein [bacterium]
MNTPEITPTEKSCVLSDSFTLQVTMLSDWHVGSGMGRPGDVNRLVVRDADDLPYIPAKTLRGVWRDACERLARGLDNGSLGGWTKLVDYIFGSQPNLGSEDVHDPTGYHKNPANKPVSSNIKISPARMSKILRHAMKQDRRLRDALTIIKPGVCIDPDTGSAKEDHLHFDEVARTGSVLKAECTLDLPEDDSSAQAISAFLLTSTLLVERLGGKRRRGMGRCKLEIKDQDVNQAAVWLENHPQAPDFKGINLHNNHSYENDPESNPSPTTEFDRWIRIPLTLTLESPLAASWRTVGNVIESLDYLPGTYLLPHITKALHKLGVDCRNAVARGDICVLPSYLEIENERGLPVPMAFSQKKGKSGFDKPTESLKNQLSNQDGSDDQYKPIRTGYVSSNNPTSLSPRRCTVPMITQTHNVVLDQSQRPDSAVGGVYSYEAISFIDNGQSVRLRSELRIRKSLVASTTGEWWKSLNGSIRLGRSTKDDYGVVMLDTGNPDDSSCNVTPDANQLVVWLLSDAILRDEMLRPATTAEALGKALGEQLSIELTPQDSFIRVRRVDSWNSNWGLPRPTLVAIKAGSCVKFLVTGEPNLKKLQDIEVTGIGERTAEGYGQVRFNDPLLTTPLAEWKKTEENNSGFPASEIGEMPPTENYIPQDALNYLFAQLIEREAWKDQIRRAVLTFAKEKPKRGETLGWEISSDASAIMKSSNPPMSQLSGLRTVLTFLKSDADKQNVITWLDRIRENKQRADKWPNGALEKVRSFIEDDTKVWTIDDIVKPGPSLTQSDIKKDLWPFAVRAFFDACIRAHKRDLDQPEGNHGA